MKLLLSLFFVLSFLAIRPAEGVAVNWVDSKRLEDKAYFLHNAAPRIEIYDLSEETWLQAINLSQIPTAFHVDADYIYVAFDKAVYRFDHDGENAKHLVNVTQAVYAVFVDGDHLFVFYPGGVQVIHRISAAKIADSGSGYGMTYLRTGISHSPEKNRFYGRSTGVSPSDIGQLVYDDEGKILLMDDSPHHGDYASATQTWPWPDGSRVTDSSGNVYDGMSLQHRQSFASRIDDLAFRGADVPIVLLEGTIKAYSNIILQTGSFNTGLPVQTIYTRDHDVAAFYPDDAAPNGIDVLFVPYDDLKAPEPGETIDAVGLKFTPNSVFIDKENILYLLAANLQSLFRWDINDQVWLPTIPLHGAPAFVTYSNVNHAVYMAYPGGQIFQIDLSDPGFAETPFANLATRPLGLIAAGEYIIGADDSGAWESHTSFGPDGNKIDYEDWNYPLNAAAWNQANRRIYHFRDGTSPNDLLWSIIEEDGSIGLQKDSPYHSSSGIAYPIRVKPDGSIVVLGSGRIYDAISLQHINSLPTGVKDVTWIGDLMFGLSGNSLIQYTSPTYGTGPTLTLSGTGHAILTTRDDQLLVLTIGEDGVPRIDVRSTTFSIVPPAVLAQPRGLRAAIESAQSVSLFWTDISGEAEYRVERRKSGDTEWQVITTTDANITAFRGDSVEAGKTYQYRVTAWNGELASEPSETLTVVLSPPDAPAEFTATVLSGFAVRLDWSASDHVTGYRLERRISGSLTWTIVGQHQADDLSYTDEALIPGTSYDYRLSAVNGLGGSDWKTVSAETPMVAPGTPSLFSPSTTAESVTLRWNTVPLAAEYVVERSLQSDPDGSWVELGVVPSPETTFIDSSVKPSTAYHYRVKARNSAGESNYSSTRSVTTPALPVPHTPQLAMPYPKSATSLLLSWQQAAYADGYRLEYQAEGATEWSFLAELPANVFEYLHTGLETGRLYTYRIQAWNESGVSGTSVASGRPAELVSLLHDDFAPEEDFRMWYRISGGKAVDGGLGFDTGSALWFESSPGTALAETMGVDLRDGGYLHFLLRAGDQAEDGGTYWKNFTSSAIVSVQYSTNGSTWQTLKTISVTYPNSHDWTAHTMTLPIQARSATTHVRWVLSGGGGNWAIDNIELRGPRPAPVPWVDYVQATTLSATTVYLQWPSPDPANTVSPINPEGVYIFSVQRRQAGGLWETIGLVDGNPYPNFVDYEAPAASTLFYRIQTLAPWDDALPSFASMVTTVSQLAQWRMANFGTIDNIGPYADTAVDEFGIANLQRYAFGLEVGQRPKTYTGDERHPGMPLVWLNESTGKLSVMFQRRMQATLPEVDYVVEFSNDLIHWLPQPAPAATRAIRGNWEEVRFDQPTVSYLKERCFARVRLVKR